MGENKAGVRCDARLDLNNPPTSVGGILSVRCRFSCRLDLNNPPTSVGGIHEYILLFVCRKDLNDPLTAVSGILLFVQSCHATQITPIGEADKIRLFGYNYLQRFDKRSFLGEIFSLRSSWLY